MRKAVTSIGASLMFKVTEATSVVLKDLLNYNTKRNHQIVIQFDRWFNNLSPSLLSNKNLIWRTTKHSKNNFPECKHDSVKQDFVLNVDAVRSTQLGREPVTSNFE